MPKATPRQLFWAVSLLSFVAASYWAGVVVPAAYETDGRAGAMLMALVITSLFLLLVLCSFLAMEVSTEIIANQARRHGNTGVSDDTTHEKKAS